MQRMPRMARVEFDVFRFMCMHLCLMFNIWMVYYHDVHVCMHISLIFNIWMVNYRDVEGYGV